MLMYIPLTQSHACAFFVDARWERIAEAKEALEDVWAHENMKGKPMLIVCNRISATMTKSEIENALDIKGLMRHSSGPLHGARDCLVLMIECGLEAVNGHCQDLDKFEDGNND
jgi:ADP-ribosylation factor family